MSDDTPSGVSIHAGFPNPASDKNLESLDISQLLIQHPISTFLFRIRGNEWEHMGIFDNDLAIVDRALDSRATDLVIWWREGEQSFAISPYKRMPEGALAWGVITTIIHQLREKRT